MVGCGDDDLKLLMAKRFILVFESGVIVIKHWKIHNYIRNDRYKPTLYQDEKALLADKDNKAYTFAEELSKHDEKLGIPDDNQAVYQMDTQVRLGKDRLGKDSKEIKDLTPSKNRRLSPSVINTESIKMFFCQMSRWRNSKQNSLMITKSESNDCQSIVNHLVRLIKTIWQLFEVGQGKKKVNLRTQAVDTSAQEDERSFLNGQSTKKPISRKSARTS